MEITVKGTPKEIVALVVAIQELHEQQNKQRIIGLNSIKKYPNAMDKELAEWFGTSVDMMRVLKEEVENKQKKM